MLIYRKAIFYAVCVRFYVQTKKLYIYPECLLLAIGQLEFL